MIRSGTVETFRAAQPAEVDFFIHALGFEKRSSAILKSGLVQSKKTMSLVFPNESRLSFNSNLAIARDLNCEFISEYSIYFRSVFPSRVEKLTQAKGRRARVAIDISSMNRTMIATVLFSTLILRQYLDGVSLIYVPGVYHEPRAEFPAIQQIGAVIPELSGFSSNPELPIGVVMGLGYEYGLAVGLINRLEPRLTVCFKATGYDPRYDEACRAANLDFDFGNNNIELASYPLLDAKSAYEYIENVVFGMTKTFRVVIVPLGPKLFAALATLIAIRNVGTVAVWRVAAKLEMVDIAPCEEFLKLELDLDCPLPKSEMSRAAHLYDQ